MSSFIYSDLLTSFYCVEGTNSNKSLLEWIGNENKKTQAILKETTISENSFWYFDSNDSVIKNRNNSFFTIQGIKNNLVEQPIIIQNEVGYLGFIGKKINGILHFLMQAKIEPGNINNVQISPTIQATKSNFTQKHGGRAPNYLDFFKNAEKYKVIYDGEEPEQCSRFYKKYNRNVVIYLEENEDVLILDHFKWMTIGQIKYFANHYDNLVNMDTRTVLSCLPYDFASYEREKTPLLNSIFGVDESQIVINDVFNECRKNVVQPTLIGLNELKDWDNCENGIFCKKQYPFCFKYYDISIDGREVTHWTQPLAVANGKALFVLGYVVIDSTMFFLTKPKKEIGCDFGVCLGPTIQFEAPYFVSSFQDSIQKDILNTIKNKKCDIFTTLSEEGGRFYHEENINVVCTINPSISLEQIKQLGYVLVTYKTIRKLIEKTHMVNIQLRNLLSLLVDNYEKD